MLLPVIGLGVLSLAAFVLQLGNNRRFLNALLFLMFAAVGSLFLVPMKEDYHTFYWGLLGVVALNFAASHVNMLRKDYVRALLPLISVGALIFLFKDKNYEFLTQQGAFINKFSIVGLFVAALGYELGVIKLKVISKLFGSISEEEAMRSLLLIFAGVGIFLCNLQSGALGILAFSAITLSASFFREKDGREIAVSLLALSALPLLMHRSGEFSASLLDGDVLEGIFLGAFAMYFIQKVFQNDKRNLFFIVLIYAISLILAVGVLYLGSQFSKMGGMDAFLGFVVGAALVNALVGEGFASLSLLPLLLACGLVLPKYLVNEALEEFEEITTTVLDDSGNAVEPKVVPLGDASGSYTILSDSSRVSFFLGEHGETKGAFRKVSGKIEIGEDPASSKFDIALKMSDFTTFSEMRDESLMSDEYFNASKNPEMRYKGSKLVSKGDDVWEIQGEFTMLGVTKALPVLVKRIEGGENTILLGSGTIDRTQFGMTPSTAEGNVVTFEYRVMLK